MRFTALPVLCLLSASAAGCIWVSDFNLNAQQSQVGNEVASVSAKELRAGGATDWAALLREKEKKMANQPTIEDRADYGGVLLHVREFEKARNVLLEAERLEPGHYAVAANLGTAFELLGDDAQALHWIQQGIKRNPDSHFGTEWVHVKILEAKIALTKDPKWLETNSVLAAQFGSEPKPVLQGVQREKMQAETMRLLLGLGHQLRERLQFTKTPDPVVGDLLFNLGNTLAVHGAVQTAEGIYKMAQEYGAPKKDLLAKRLQLAQRIVKVGLRSTPRAASE